MGQVLPFDVSAEMDGTLFWLRVVWTCALLVIFARFPPVYLLRLTLTVFALVVWGI